MPATPQQILIAQQYANALSDAIDQSSKSNTSQITELQKSKGKLTSASWSELIKIAIETNLFKINLGDSNTPSSLTKNSNPDISAQDIKISHSQTITLLHLFAKDEIRTDLEGLKNIFSMTAPGERIDAINELVDRQLDDAINAISNAETLFIATKLSASTRQEAKGFLYQITSSSEAAKLEFIQLMAKTDNKPSPKKLMKFFSNHALNHPFELADDGLIVKKGGNKESDAFIILDNNSYQVLLATSDQEGEIEKDSFLRHSLVAMSLSAVLPHVDHKNFIPHRDLYKNLCKLSGIEYSEPPANVFINIGKSKCLKPRRAKAHYWHSKCFELLSSRPGLCNHLIESKNPFDGAENIDFENDFVFTANFSKFVDYLYEGSQKPGLFFGFNVSKNADKDPNLFNVDNLATERAIMYTLTHINNLLKKSSNYSSNSFDEISPSMLFHTLIDPKINIPLNKAELVNYTQVDSYIDCFVADPASLINKMTASSNSNPSMNDKILYSNVLMSISDNIPAHHNNTKTILHQRCLDDLKDYLTDEAVIYFSDTPVPAEYTTSIRDLEYFEFPDAISNLKKAFLRNNYQPAIDLLQKLATQSEITIDDKTITIDTESQELAKQALNELNINPITKSQNSPGQPT